MGVAAEGPVGLVVDLEELDVDVPRGVEPDLPQKEEVVVVGGLGDEAVVVDLDLEVQAVALEVLGIDQEVEARAVGGVLPLLQLRDALRDGRGGVDRRVVGPRAG